MAINYPYRVFRYQVEIDGISRAGFSEVSGMSASRNTARATTSAIPPASWRD